MLSNRERTLAGIAKHAGVSARGWTENKPIESPASWKLAARFTGWRPTETNRKANGDVRARRIATSLAQEMTEIAIRFDRRNGA